MVSEKDLQSYLKVAASALPCREARKEFSSYVHNVAHDISIENPDADFATVASLLGTERSDDRQHRDYLYRFRWRRLLTERTR